MEGRDSQGCARTTVSCKLGDVGGKCRVIPAPVRLLVQLDAPENEKLGRVDHISVQAIYWRFLVYSFNDIIAAYVNYISQVEQF